MTDGADDAAWRPPPTPAAPTEQLPGYADLEEIGRGGDSVVYRAREVALGREVAIKVLSLDTAGDPARAARFAREIEITVQLGRQHPNIVTVLATGTTASGRPAVVMDFFDLGTLHDRLRAHGPLAPEEVGRIGEVLADALSFAHERGVLHRDVKPQNVLVLPTSWVLADFGIARLVDAEHTSSAETFTYRHAAPQILDGHPPTAADDIWSLGSTLFTLLDGRPPFASDDPDDDSALAYLRRARTEEPRPLQVPGAERVAPVIMRCLSKDVAARWTSAAELRDALHALRASAWEPSGAGSPGAATAAPLTLDKPPTPDPVPSAHTPTPTPTREQTPTPLQAPSAADAAPAEPAPVALSAVSHELRGHDAAPTGTGLPDPTGPPPDAARPAAPGPEAPADEAPRRRRLPLVLGAVALALGLVLGVVGAALRGGGDPVPVARTLGPTTTVVDPGEQPTLEGRPDLPVVLQNIEWDGATMVVQFTDPTDGEGRFQLLLLRDGVELPVPVARFPPGSGQPEERFPVSELPTGRGCFYVVVYLPSGRYGVSDRSARCFDITPFSLDLPAAPGG
ncbi:serine/threonine-protein kinase [Nocardioides litoris]|uniref:serine/threonine-protein kinase n=1 Tax=Nocardioides litoris TaxID=1926648 RepID=UPI001121FE56|nr:serine/threonine-protein kinase [Nocardioides litoris]